MTSTVAIASPASPRALAPLLSGADRERALSLPGLGGSPVNNLVEAFVAAGARVELVTLAREVGERTVLEGPRLRILIAPYRERPRDRTRDLFREERRHVAAMVAATSAPVVHARWTYEFALGALAGAGRPVVVTAGDAPFTVLRYSPDPYRLGRTALAILTRLRLGFLSTTSPHMADAWRRQMAYRKPIRVVPNVIPPAPPGDGRTEPGALTILDVTSADKLKNAASLLRAMGRILRVEPGARCRLVGPGLTRESELGRLAERLGVGHAVDFVGPVDRERLHEEYAKATVFVHSSLEEAFGMSVAEAMSYGLPVVGGARAGGVPWVLGGGDAGVLVDMRRPERIADAVCELLADSGMRAEFGARALARVRSSFSAEAVTAAARQMYEDVRKGSL